MSNQTLIGVSNNNLVTFDTALGAKVPVVRDYSWVGSPFPMTAWAPLLAGRVGVLSDKFRDANGHNIPAVDISGNKWDSALASKAKAYAKLPTAEWGNGKHKVTAEHEANSQASAGSGTMPELDKAIARVFDIYGNTPGFLDKCELWFCTTGWKIQDLGPFVESIKAAVGIYFDQPYRQKADTAAQSVALATTDIDYITAKFPGHAIGIGEWGAAPALDRPTWISGILASLYKSGMEFATYWNGPGFALDGDPASIAALVAGMRAGMVPPAVEVSAADWAVLKGIVGKY